VTGDNHIDTPGLRGERVYHAPAPRHAPIMYDLRDDLTSWPARQPGNDTTESGTSQDRGGM
jgi:hypothetical protein